MISVRISVFADVNEAADLEALQARVLSLFAADPDDLFPEIEAVDDCEIRGWE